jgi:serine/threonine protein kinase
MPSRKTRRKQSKQSKQSAGSEIGSGAYGTVYSPPLKCLNTNGTNVTKYYNTNYISKIFTMESMSGYSAHDEYKNGLLVKTLDPTGSWSITPELLCPIDKTQTNANFLKKNASDYTNQLIYKNGGIPMYAILLKDGLPIKPFFDDAKFYKDYDPEKLTTYVDCAKQVMTILPQLHTKYAHNDLHDANVLYNPEDKKARLIDFAEVKTIESLVEPKLTKFINRFGITDTHDLEPIQATFEDDVKRYDYAKIYDNIVGIINSKWARTVKPGHFQEWYTYWVNRIDEALEDGTIRARFYSDAIKALP